MGPRVQCRPGPGQAKGKGKEDTVPILKELVTCRYADNSKLRRGTLVEV